jgi:hypothetical protein
VVRENGLAEIQAIGAGRDVNSHRPSDLCLGIDVGGTFTDLVAILGVIINPGGVRSPSIELTER